MTNKPEHDLCTKPIRVTENTYIKLLRRKENPKQRFNDVIVGLMSNGK